MKHLINLIFLFIIKIFVVSTTEKFFLYCPCYGSMGDQMLLLTRAMEISYRINRTLIIPPFYEVSGNERKTCQPLASADHKIKLIPIRRIFNINELKLKSKLKFVHLEDFQKDPEMKLSLLDTGYFCAGDQSKETCLNACPVMKFWANVDLLLLLSFYAPQFHFYNSKEKTLDKLLEHKVVLASGLEMDTFISYAFFHTPLEKNGLVRLEEKSWHKYFNTVKQQQHLYFRPAYFGDIVERAVIVIIPSKEKLDKVCTTKNKIKSLPSWIQCIQNDSFPLHAKFCNPGINQTVDDVISRIPEIYHMKNAVVVTESNSSTSANIRSRLFHELREKGTGIIPGWFPYYRREYPHRSVTQYFTHSMIEREMEVLEMAKSAEIVFGSCLDPLFTIMQRENPNKVKFFGQ